MTKARRFHKPVHGCRVIVIGAGFGGMAAGIRLQAAGAHVTIVEARSQAGGRASQLKDQGYTFDMGPTLITAPELLEGLWSAAGRNMEDYLSICRLSPFYRIHFRDGSYFDYWGDAACDEREIARFNAADVEGYRRFLLATKEIYERAFVDLAHKPFDRLLSFITIIPDLVRVGAVRSVYDFTARYFKDPRLRMVFSFHPLFIGGNPFRASAIYSIVPYLERQGGVHFAHGGMYSLIQGMERLFIELGGRIQYDAPVRQIVVQNKRVTGVMLNDGTQIPASKVVSNADATRTLTKLLSEEARSSRWNAEISRYKLSMSCFLLYLGVTRTYPQLRHHTIIMPEDYREHIREVFDGYGLPEEFALYLHAPTRTDPSLAPPECESLYILTPVPHLEKGIDWSTSGPELRDRIVEFLELEFGLTDLSNSIAVEHWYTPEDFESDLLSQAGSAFSIEPTLTQSAYFRPHNRVSHIQGLYLVGAGTHPGAGLPGTLLSAEITSEIVGRDLGLCNNGQVDNSI